MTESMREFVPGRRTTDGERTRACSKKTPPKKTPHKNNLLDISP